MPHFLTPILVTLLLTATITLAEIRVTNIRSDDCLIIPLDEFGFTHSGHLVLSVSHIKLSNPQNPKPDLSRTGTAHGWDVLFYIFSFFFKGIILFMLIGLIGTGWPFLKPHLQDKEKKVLMIVIPLQVIANVAQVVIVIYERGPFAEDLYTWKKVFLLVDILCSFAVLFPIVWSIKNLREAANSDE